MLNRVLCLLLLFYTNFCFSYDLPEVETPLGKIIGEWRNSNGGIKYAAFEGIPYAKPPIGELRFEEPQPVEPWFDVLNAIETHTCIQDISGEQIEGDEDCLYLNVFVPSDRISAQQYFDVLVFIHGGGFNSGSGHMMADSNIFMDRGYIVVSINYRLAILGFLSTEDEAIPGNNGMKDQVLALKWVKDNIASFGGNPDSVTISGVSAGGVSVHLHYFSPMSKGLFNRGLSQSGTALDPFAIRKNPLEDAKKLAVLLGCPTTSTYELKQCLKEKPAIIFIKSLDYFFLYNATTSVPFAPVIEKVSANPFIEKDPYLLLTEEKVLDLPWITSTTTDEGLVSSGLFHKQLEKMDYDWPDIAHYLLDYTYTLPVSRREEVAEKIKEFYLGPNENINEKNFKKFTQIFTDRAFVTGAELAARVQARVNTSPVYYYFFNYKEGQNKMTQILFPNDNIEGVSHGEDILYFYTSFMFQNMSEKDIKLRNACQDMLYSYATTGKPSFDGTDKWQPINDSELIYLNITGPENMELQTTEHLAPSEFWKSLGFMENENLFPKNEL